MNSEKYEIKIRDWDRPDNLVPFITRLNDLRRRHPALQQLRDLHIHTTNEDSVLCFSKRSGEDVVVVVVDLSPGDDKVVRLTIDPTDIGLEWGIPFVLQDELSGEDASFDGVDISAEQPARIFAVVTP
ncbi:MAG: hypothetical protein ACXWW1_09795 [Aeromicrobium sp.]